MNDQLSMVPNPRTSRRTDPHTSRTAAPDARKISDACFVVFVAFYMSGANGLTDDELRRELRSVGVHWAHGSYAKRRHDLCADPSPFQGGPFLEAARASDGSLLTRSSDAGRPAQVWVLR